MLVIVYLLVIKPESGPTGDGYLALVMAIIVWVSDLTKSAFSWQESKADEVEDAKRALSAVHFELVQMIGALFPFEYDEPAALSESSKATLVSLHAVRKIPVEISACVNKAVMSYERCSKRPAFLHWGSQYKGGLEHRLTLFDLFSAYFAIDAKLLQLGFVALSSRRDWPKSIEEFKKILGNGQSDESWEWPDRERSKAEREWLAHLNEKEKS